MTAAPQLIGRDGTIVRLDPNQPLSIGRDPANRLCLAADPGISRRHALLRPARGWNNQWLLCDLGSANGTYLDGRRIRDCQPLQDGDEIRLGQRGPQFIFRLGSAPGSGARPGPAAGAAASAGRAAQAAPGPATGKPTAIDFAGIQLLPEQIRDVRVRSQPRFPNIFSWWLLLCLGGLLLLPFPWIFWPLEIAALGLWIALGSRRDHLLEVNLKDGRVFRHGFESAPTALAHRNGIRRAMGWTAPAQAAAAAAARSPGTGR